MAEARGIEVFGRGATIVETGFVKTGIVESGPRVPWLGVLAIGLGLLAAVATGLGVGSAAGGAADGAADGARWWAYAAIGCGILGVIAGVAAVATRRGRAAGVAGIALSLIANPWILTRLLDAVGPLLTSAS